ncbi:hypothetical protein ACF058_11060 [Streptomyces sp. NPDC015501]|uniref:hypothetical protein n=1 Tax=unclassified Streptomyces TaxID=2593676 RepID=UPI0011A77909|nr:hypothetical protein A3L22_13580 [Streptomyces griseus subsp. griseus]
MALTDFARRAAPAPAAPSANAPAAAERPAEETAAPAPAPAGGTDARTDVAASRPAGREADGLAVASFVLGLVGLLVFNLVLGPTAIVMALLSLARRTRRRGRARLGLALGVADLVVLAVLVTADGAVAWNVAG